MATKLWSEVQKANGVKLELTWFKPRKFWKKYRDGKVYYLHYPNSKSGYEAALLEWAQVRAKTDNERPNADVFQHHKRVFQQVKAYYDQFGIPQTEAPIARQVDELLEWIEECLVMPELPQPIEFIVRCAKLPQLFEELKYEFPELGTLAFNLPDKWQDRVDRLGNANLKKHPQTIGYWIEAYINRVKNRGGKFIEQDTVNDRRYKLQHFLKYADQGAHVTTIDDEYIEKYHHHLDQFKSKITKHELSRDSKFGYFKAFRMFVRWAASKSSCELTPPTNLDSREFTFREPKGTGRRREEKKAWLWTPHEIKTALASLPSPYPCFILVMLNCGFRHTDVSELQWSDLRLDEQRIVIQRKKLNQQDTAPVISYKLWDKTVELIKETMSKHPKFVFVNSVGGQVEGSIKTWWGRNRKDFGLDGKRLDYIRKTGSTFIASIDHNLDELYLGESLSTTAKRHYSFRDGEPNAALDDGISRLGAEFGFAEPPPKTIVLTSELKEKLEAAGIEV